MSTSGKEKDEYFNPKTKNPELTPPVRSAVIGKIYQIALCSGEAPPVSVSRVRVEILRSKILPDLDAVNNRIMQQGQGALFSLALNYRYGKVDGP